MLGRVITPGLPRMGWHPPKGRAAPKDRPRHRPRPEYTRDFHLAGTGPGAFWLFRVLRGERLHGLQRANPGTAGLEPNRPRPPHRPRKHALYRELNESNTVHSEENRHEEDLVYHRRFPGLRPHLG